MDPYVRARLSPEFSTSQIHQPRHARVADLAAGGGMDLVPGVATAAWPTCMATADTIKLERG